MSQIVEGMSDAELLGVIVGGKTAARMLKDAGSISALLNQSIAPYDPQPRMKTRVAMTVGMGTNPIVPAARKRKASSSE